MRMWPLATILFVIPVLTAGCNAAELNVKARAASDFSCESSQVSVTSAGTDSSFRATGCGHEATYTCSNAGAPNGAGASDPVCTREGNVQ